MNTRSIELNLIAQDTIDLTGLISNLLKSSNSGVVCLGLLPYFALFAQETKNYFTIPKNIINNKYINTSLFETYSRTTTKLRARVKLFDDTEGGFDRLIDTLSLVSNKSHKGIKKKIFRCLQPDLGIFYLNGHAICTTHIALLTIGLTYEQLQKIEFSDFVFLRDYSLNLSKSMGNYLKFIANNLKDNGYILPNNTKEQFILSKFNISHNDYFGYSLYKHIDSAMKINKDGLSATLLFLVCQINYVERVFSKLIPNSSIFLFRVRFLTAYHATNAINQLSKMNGYFGNKEFISFLETISNNFDSKKILELRNVRNSCAHYGIHISGINLINSKKPFEDIIKNQSGFSLNDLSRLASRQLLCISEAIEPFISKNIFLKYKAVFGNHT